MQQGLPELALVQSLLHAEDSGIMAVGYIILRVTALNRRVKIDYL